ncbi:hypothetical protein D910_04844, partial [Dendroctonus ponderosae]
MLQEKGPAVFYNHWYYHGRMRPIDCLHVVFWNTASGRTRLAQLRDEPRDDRINRPQHRGLFVDLPVSDGNPVHDYRRRCRVPARFQRPTPADAAHLLYRDKNLLSSPILTSAGITFKYHLGTISLGSLIILQIQIFKALLKVMMSHRWCRNIAVACLNYFEEIFRFLSKNSYIVTAMHGQGFFQSGKRAVKLLVQNISNVIALNFIGDFVLAVAVVIVVVISVSVSAFIFYLAP